MDHGANGGAGSGNDIPDLPDILSSFPNLAGLGRLPGTVEDWGSRKLSRLPSEARSGSLSNGLNWIVQENKEPKTRAELYLIVGFGSLVEEDHERGIAHIIEHLGFSATKSYENHEIVKFLESIGAPFGACQNAYTTFDRTVYTLHVPTDKEELLPESLKILREFAFYTRISQEDLDKERKVVLEEWRESKSPKGRMFEQYIEALCKNCKWSERLPIGKEEVIRNVSAETLRKFYQKYYHPSCMSVVAVGDFDGESVINMIKDLFDINPSEISPLPRSETGPERPMHAVPDTPGVLAACSTDPELSYPQAVLDCKRPRTCSTTVAAVRRLLTEDVFHKAMNARLLKRTIEPKGPRCFFAVNTETGNPVPPLAPLSISFSPLPGCMRQALQTVAEEIERVKRLGFHESELFRAKRAALAEYEESYIERNQRPSEDIAEEYVVLLLDGIPAPGMEEQARIASTVIPGIAQADIANIAKEYDFSRNMVIKIATPPLSIIKNPMYTGWSVLQSVWQLRLPRFRMDLPESQEVAEILKLKILDEQPIEPWPQDEDEVETRLQRRVSECSTRCRSDAADLSTMPQTLQAPCALDAKGGIPPEFWSQGVAPESSPSLGTEFRLKNGMRIFVKESDQFDDEIVLRARKWGGLSDHMADGYLDTSGVRCEAQTASMVAMVLGICGLSVESLQECLDGRRVQPNPPGLETYTTDMSASSSPVDLEILFMLLHLLFMYPVSVSATSKARLSLVKFGLLAWRLGESRDPQAVFGRRVQKCITQDHPFTRLPNLWSIFRLNFNKACAVFNEGLVNPCEWTFVFVGKLPQLQKLRPMLERYLGSIPNTPEGEKKYLLRQEDVCRGEVDMRMAVVPLDVKFPAKSVRDDVKLKMVDPKGSTLLCFPVSLSTTIETTSSTEVVEAEVTEFFKLRLMVRMLETRLIEVLRFKRGQVYSVSASVDLSLVPPRLGTNRTGRLSIGFECDPAESDELVQVSLGELSDLRTGKTTFTPENAAAAVEQARREQEEHVRQNDWWALTVLDLYFSRCYALTGKTDDTVSSWWRANCSVLKDGGFDAEMATTVLKEKLPVDAASAVIVMRP